jgi:DNA-binding GntR family transcriptional regulator
MDEFADTGDLLGYAEANWDFHFALFERAGLPRLYRITEVLWRVSEAYRGAIFAPSWLGRARKDHWRILEACKAGDIDETITAQDEHRSNAMARITIFFESRT